MSWSRRAAFACIVSLAWTSHSALTSKGDHLDRLGRGFICISTYGQCLHAYLHAPSVFAHTCMQYKAPPACMYDTHIPA